MVCLASIDCLSKDAMETKRFPCGVHTASHTKVVVVIARSLDEAMAVFQPFGASGVRVTRGHPGIVLVA